MRTKSLDLYLDQNVWYRAGAIIFFAALTALTARITIHLPFTPIPVTLQTLAVVLSGLVLGARAGALAQATYLSLIVIGVPLDANALGPAALLGPTAGYLVGFLPAAGLTGWLTENVGKESWWGNFVAAMAGVFVIYGVGVGWLAVVIGSLAQALVAGVLPFILFDLVKAAIAAGAAESGKKLLNR
jgi:biotin transport system substrate-specific component